MLFEHTNRTQMRQLRQRYLLAAAVLVPAIVGAALVVLEMLWPSGLAEIANRLGPLTGLATNWLPQPAPILATDAYLKSLQNEAISTGQLLPGPIAFARSLIPSPRLEIDNLAITLLIGAVLISSAILLAVTAATIVQRRKLDAADRHEIKTNAQGLYASIALLSFVGVYGYSFLVQGGITESIEMDHDRLRSLPSFLLHAAFISVAFNWLFLLSLTGLSARVRRKRPPDVAPADDISKNKAGQQG